MVSLEARDNIRVSNIARGRLADHTVHQDAFAARITLHLRVMNSVDVHQIQIFRDVKNNF